MPPGLRKSGIPDSVLMPAPVNTTTRVAPSISRFSAAVSLSLVIARVWQNRRIAPRALQKARTPATSGLLRRDAPRNDEPVVVIASEAKQSRRHLAVREKPM